MCEVMSHTLCQETLQILTCERCRGARQGMEETIPSGCEEEMVTRETSVTIATLKRSNTYKHIPRLIIGSSINVLCMYLQNFVSF